MINRPILARQGFDPALWNGSDPILFYEYFHSDNGAGLGASHQTGWTGLVTKLTQQSGGSVCLTLSDIGDVQ